MTQYYIIEIQQYPNGEYGHIVHYAWDENPDKARLKAESKYHEVLAAAAISETKKHSAIILSDESFPILYGCYKHDVEAPAPVQEPEEVIEPEETEPEEQTETGTTEEPAGEDPAEEEPTGE